MTTTNMKSSATEENAPKSQQMHNSMDNGAVTPTCHKSKSTMMEALTMDQKAWIKVDKCQTNKYYMQYFS